MKSFLILFFLSNSLMAQSLILKADLDPREVTFPKGYQLWSQVQADKILFRPIREEILNASTQFLEEKISISDFIQLLKNWGQIGFNKQERVILSDTLKKSQLNSEIKNQWLCRLNSDRNCKKIRIFPDHLAPILQKYEWLSIDGQTFERLAWNEITVPNEPLTWIFLSSRFETYTFHGYWEDLKFKNPQLQDWVSGSCEAFQVSSEVQSLDTQVLINRNCFKSSMNQPKIEPSFYEKNKNKIWIAAGLILGVGTYTGLSGKKIIIERPSFK